VSSQHPIDERLEQLEEIETRVTIVEQRLDAIANNLDQIEQATLGPEESSEKYEREPLVDLLEDVRATAELAKATAGNSVSSDGGRSKKDIALEISRDELVRQAAEGKNAGPRDMKSGERADIGGSVDVGDVRRMARPETELKWKTVARDAWPDLLERWPCFRVEDDPKRLVIEPNAVSSELARLVEESLGREALANRVVGATATEGGGRR